VMKLDFLLTTVTKARLGSVLLAVLSLIVSQAIATTTHPASVSALEVAVRVRLYEAKSGEALKDYSEVVAWLVPVRTFLKLSHVGPFDLHGAILRTGFELVVCLNDLNRS
jgi:hypothetical protein